MAVCDKPFTGKIQKNVRNCVNCLNINALKDLQANNSFWDKYDGITAEVADRVNDIYLKANRQIDGVKSYGKVVDLMLGYQRIMQ